MAKNKPSTMPLYELMYIIPQKFSEEEAEQVMDKVSKQLEKAGGTIKITENWGKKKLAYQIKGYAHGYYVVLVCEIPAEKIQPIERALRMMPEVLRHLIVRLSVTEKKKKPRKAHAERPKETREKPAPKQIGEVPKKDPKKMDLKDLDQKLDKLLEVDHLL